MMDWIGSLLPLALIWAVAVITPGPNFLAIMHAAVTKGRPAAIATALGTLAGTMVWAFGGVFGLKALFAILPWSAAFIKAVGAAYLIWTGVSTWRQAAKPPFNPDLRQRRGMDFLRGFATVIANPKTAAFAASLFAVAVPVGSSIGLAFAAVATISLVSALWYLTLAAIGSFSVFERQYRRLRTFILRLTGVLFAGFGLKLAAEIP